MLDGAVFGNGRSRIAIRLDEGTVWLLKNLIAEMYQITKQTTGYHIRNIFEENELSPEATVRHYLTVQTEGSRTVKSRFAIFPYVSRHIFCPAFPLPKSLSATVR